MKPPLTLPQPGPPATQPAELRRVMLNAASLLGAYVLPRLFTVAAVVVAARVLGPVDFGAYGTAGAYAVILSIVATLGMMPLLVRELARSPERAPALLWAAHAVKAGSNVLMLVALAALARWVLGFSEPVVAAALLLGASYAVGAFVENLGAYFQAIERMHVWMQGSAIFGLVTGILGAVIVWTTGSFVWFCAAPIAGQLAALAWLLRRLPPALRLPAGLEGGDVGRLARALVPFAAAFVALTVFYKVDVLLLARWRPAAEVGAYVAAYKFVDMLHALSLAGIAAVYPRLARQAPAPGQRQRWAATRVTELVVLAVVPVGAMLWLARTEAVHALYGGGYADAVPVLALLAPAMPALTVNLLAGYVLGATRRMGIVAVVYGLGVAVKVGLNAVLVPRYGATGAAAAMLVSEVLLALGFMAVLRTTVAAAPDLRTVAMAGLAAAACLTLGLASPAVLPGILATALYAAAVLILYWRGQVLPAREWRAVREAFKP